MSKLSLSACQVIRKKTKAIARLSRTGAAQCDVTAFKVTWKTATRLRFMVRIQNFEKLLV